ncbi:MAG: uroporphyrin-III C-methyltransferase, partial [Dehalococcoidia bacterium]|nr:uroporphyrin-III C-methyltransferase [Dehalococcoidia bacterium]
MTSARGKAYIVGAGPGDPGLITVKGLEALRQADVVIYDRLLNPYLLAQASQHAEWVYAGKGPHDRVMTQDEIDTMLVQKTAEGKTVVRLKGGDPFIFGRGGEEAQALARHGLDFEIVPGVSSVIAAPAYAGIPLTHRAVSSSFAVITGQEDSSKESPSVSWERLVKAVDTLVVVMGAESLPQTIAKLLQHGLAADTPVAVVQWGTDPRQCTVTGTLSNILVRVQEAGVGAPSVVVVGDVVRLRDEIRWFDNKPLFGKRVLVTRSREVAGNLSRKLEEVGAQPVELPTIDIRPPRDWGPLDKALGKLAEYQWAVFTSVNPVEMVWQRLRASGRDARAFAEVRICAIGPATAQALRSHGLEPDSIPERYTSEDLLNELGERGVAKGARVLVPRSDIAAEELVTGLEELGAVVDQVPAYRTAVPDGAQEKARQLLSLGQVDIATFTSSSTVQNLVTLLGESAPTLLRPITVACIGQVTARAAQRLGIRVDIVARESTIAGLVEAIVQAYEPRE